MQKAVPLVSIAVLQPFVTALREAGFDPQEALSLLDYQGEPSERPETLVHTNRINRFLDECAEMAGDRTFCSRVGSKLDPEGWPMIYAALDRATSLAEFISIYIDGANRVATSVDTYLEVRGKEAAFGQRRIARPDTMPGQNDAFMASLYVAMIRLACGETFDPGKVSLVVCDPAALAEDVARCHILRGDRMGHRVQFPSTWLAGRGEAEDVPQNAALHRKDLLSTLRVQLQQNISARPLKAGDVAEHCGISLSRLKRALARQNTSITAEIDHAKLVYAQSQLRQSAMSVHDIATTLGYTDASNFTRWFRGVTGTTPSQYREASPKIDNALTS
ncbi:MAG: helix-turn-helix domain-containing protein [Pseudomonadota bacterium]